MHESWLIYLPPTPSSSFQTGSQAPPERILIQAPPNKYQLPLLLTLHTLTVTPASVQIHNLKYLPHALYHLDGVGRGEDAAFESVDRECGF